MISQVPLEVVTNFVLNTQIASCVALCSPHQQLLRAVTGIRTRKGRNMFDPQIFVPSLGVFMFVKTPAIQSYYFLEQEGIFKKNLLNYMIHTRFHGGYLNLYRSHICRYEWYKNRVDKMETRRIDHRKRAVRETFAIGRKDHLLSK